MMKKVKLFALILGAAALVQSCNTPPNCITPNGSVTQEYKTHTNFNTINLVSYADVYITKDSTYSVMVETDSNIQPFVIIHSGGDDLDITHQSNSVCPNGNHTLNIYISMPELKEINLTGSGDIHVSGDFSTTEFDTQISGSGDVIIDYMDADVMDLDISGSGGISVLAGGGMTQNIQVAGSGDINTYGAPYGHVNVNISGSGSATLWANQTLDVNIGGSGDVMYGGNPVVTSNVGGSGGVYPF